MKRKAIAALIAALLLIAPVQALAQDDGPEPVEETVTAAETDVQQQIPVDSTLIWLVVIIGGWASFAALVPVALQAAKGQFLDRLLIVIWSALRTIVGFFAEEGTPRFQETFDTLRDWIIILVVAGGAWGVSETVLPQLLEGAPEYIAMIDMIYLKVLAVIFLTGGAFLFHAAKIKELFPVESFKGRMKRVADKRQLSQAVKYDAAHG